MQYLPFDRIIIYFLLSVFFYFFGVSGIKTCEKDLKEKKLTEKEKERYYKVYLIGNKGVRLAGIVGIIISILALIWDGIRLILI